MLYFTLNFEIENYYRNFSRYKFPPFACSGASHSGHGGITEPGCGSAGRTGSGDVRRKAQRISAPYTPWGSLRVTLRLRTRRQCPVNRTDALDQVVLVLHLLVVADAGIGEIPIPLLAASLSMRFFVESVSS